MNEQILSEGGKGMSQCFKNDSASRGEDQKGLASVGVAPTPQSSHLVNGLPVFLDGDAELDRIRLTAKDPVVIIMAVAIRRAQQIARNYASKHAPHLSEKINHATYEFIYRFEDNQ